MGTLLFKYKDQLVGDLPFKLIRYKGQSLDQPLHMHDYMQIAYVVRGVCTHVFCQKTLTVGKGDIFIIPPGVAHSLKAIENKDFELVLLDFMPFLVHDQLKPFSQTIYDHLMRRDDLQSSSEWLQPWLHISQDKQLLVEQLLQDIQDEFERKEEGYEFSTRINLVKLLILIDREYRKRGRNRNAGPVNRTQQRHFDDVVRYVYDHYDQDIPLEQAAYIANMAPAYFSHLFKKETGQTFVEFLHEVRIERAMDLIRQDAMTMTGICFRVGFRHLSHFIRTFKKRTGMTPTEYKKAFLNNEKYVKDD